MPRNRIAMNHIEEILRRRHEAGRSQREIASGCGMAQSSVHNVLARAKAAGLGWPLPAVPRRSTGDRLAPPPSSAFSSAPGGPSAIMVPHPQLSTTP